jgi:hypothetical protein
MLNTYVLYHALASLAAFDNRAVLPHPPGPYTTNGDRQLEELSVEYHHLPPVYENLYHLHIATDVNRRCITGDMH